MGNGREMMTKSARTKQEPNGVREHSTTDEQRIKTMIMDWAKSIERILNDLASKHRGDRQD
jgi:hypothetical protein